MVATPEPGILTVAHLDYFDRFRKFVSGRGGRAHLLNRIACLGDRLSGTIERWGANIPLRKVFLRRAHRMPGNFAMRAGIVIV